MVGTAKPRLALAAPLVVAGVLAGGCLRNVRGPCDTPPPFFVRLGASARVNPDAQGHPLPTAVELIQLKGLTGFEKQEFAEVFRSPKDALGEEFLRSDELMVDTGQAVTRWVERDAKASYVAAVGIFRQPSGTTWRAVLPLPLVLSDQCQPQKGERKGPPTEEDVQIRLMLEEFRITADARPTPIAGRGP